MSNIHFLPARTNRARLKSNLAAAQPTSMPEHNSSSQQTQAEPQPVRAAVFGLNDNKTKRYEQLVRHFHADVYRYGYWLCKDADIAQDLVQETFLRAWKSLDSLLDANAAKAWLITILRRENARRFERKQFDYDDGAEQDSLPDTEQTSAEQSLDNEKLRSHIATLPAEYREPLVLQALAGFSSDEIASLLQLNVNTVNTRLFRARKLLRNQLEVLGEPRHG